MSATRIGLALTWDGVRHPTRALPPKARVFLGGRTAASAAKVAELFRDEQITEIRVCWVPRLAGGDDVLAVPFVTPNGRRIAFKSTRTQRFGDVLGVVYRR